MWVKTVQVGYRRKLQSHLSQYPLGEVEFVLWADVHPGDDLNQVCQQLWETAKANVHHQVLVALGRQDEADARFPNLGLPEEPWNGTDPAMETEDEQ